MKNEVCLNFCGYLLTDRILNKTSCWNAPMTHNTLQYYALEDLDKIPVKSTDRESLLYLC